MRSEGDAETTRLGVGDGARTAWVTHGTAAGAPAGLSLVPLGAIMNAGRSGPISVHKWFYPLFDSPRRREKNGT